MLQVTERNLIVREVLESHVETLEAEFGTFEEFQDLFIDVFGNNIDSSDNLTKLRNQFAEGTLRPNVEFVSSETLTDAEGNARGAAFDSESETILLSEDLNAEEVESSIEQELGHWWDVQLNGTEDTTTVDGKPFDEGTAYAERFNEGAQGDNIFSNSVYQPDLQTVMVNGQETEVEFRNIGTWNIQGARNGDNITWENVFDVMNNPQNFNPIEVMAIQEAGNPGEVLGIEPTRDFINGRVVQYDLERGGENFRIYWTLGDMSQNPRNLAIVLRNPQPQEDGTRLISLYNNPRDPRGGNLRPILGVESEGNMYYAVHAQVGGINNDAEAILDFLADDPDVLEDREERNIQNTFTLGDFNRNIANDDDPVGEVNDVFRQQRWRDALIRPNATTQNARNENPTNTLDYMFTGANLVDDDGTVLNDLDDANTQAFPSDHFPVAYDDRVDITGSEIGVQIFSPDQETPTTSLVTNEVGTGTEFNDLPDADLSGPGNPVDVNIDINDRGNITLEVDENAEAGTFDDGDFNGYVFTDISNSISNFERVFVDGTNDLGINDSDITVEDSNTFAINVAGIDYAPGDVVELTTDFV